MLQSVIEERIAVRREGGRLFFGERSFPETELRITPTAYESEWVGPTGGAIRAPDGSLIGDVRTANVLLLPEGQEFFLLISKTGSMELVPA